MNVKTIFLHDQLEDKIYMNQLEGYVQEGQEINVCLLNKSLYGLEQSPRQWYKEFDSFMIKARYNKCEYDSCLFQKE